MNMMYRARSCLYRVYGEDTTSERKLVFFNCACRSCCTLRLMHAYAISSELRILAYDVLIMLGQLQRFISYKICVSSYNTSDRVAASCMLCYVTFGIKCYYGCVCFLRSDDNHHACCHFNCGPPDFITRFVIVASMSKFCFNIKLYLDIMRKYQNVYVYPIVVSVFHA